jgi:hypothetical protein
VLVDGVWTQTKSPGGPGESGAVTERRDMLQDRMEAALLFLEQRNSKEPLIYLLIEYS